jgi:hypothetical protein
MKHDKVNRDLIDQQAIELKRSRCIEGSLLQRIVRHLSIYVEGKDYKDLFQRLEKQHKQSDLVGRCGYFKSRGTKYRCIITGVVVRLRSADDYIIVNYIRKNGDYIIGAEIDRASFIPT